MAPVILLALPARFSRQSGQRWSYLRFLRPYYQRTQFSATLSNLLTRLQIELFVLLLVELLPDRPRHGSPAVIDILGTSTPSVKIIPATLAIRAI